jgi:hypothetical protein
VLLGGATDAAATAAAAAVVGAVESELLPLGFLLVTLVFLAGVVAAV